MKVFACKCQSRYGGGLIIVAANDKEEAFLTAASGTEWWSSYFHWYDFDKDRVIPPNGNLDYVHSDEFPLDFWYEIPALTADVSEPRVIDCDCYLE